MKAVSVMISLVVDTDDRRLFQEIEVEYEDGTKRSLKVDAHRSLKVDLSTLWREPPMD